MVEQQLIDYIKKARDAGQTDDQSKSMLLKNGWTEAEVGDAFTSFSEPSQPKLSPEPEVQNTVAPIVQAQPPVEPIQQTQPEPQIINQPKIQPATQPERYEMSHAHKSFLAIKLLITFIIVVILCIVGYFVAGQYINLPWNPFKENPETVIGKMMVNMNNVKSSHIIVAGEVAVTDDKKTSLGKLSFDTEAKGDITDINNIKNVATFSIKLALPTTTILVDLETRVVGNALYFIVNNVTAPTEDLYSGITVSQIKGKWFKLDQDSVTAMSSINPQQIIALDVSRANNFNVIKNIQDLLLKEDILSFNKQLKDEVINGQKTYHYLLTINKDKLESTINKSIDSQLQATANSQDDLTGASFAKNIAEAFVATITDAIGNANIEIWVGKKDYMLYGTKIDKAIDLNTIYPGINMKVGIKLDIANSDFNQPVIVKTPENSQKLEEVILPIIKNSTIQSDVKQIDSIAQSLFNTNKSYSSLCRGGLLNGYLASYGTDLVNINNDLVNQGAQKPACFGGLQGYCLSTQLADNSYLCIDERGIFGNKKCISSFTVCE